MKKIRKMMEKLKYLIPISRKKYEKDLVMMINVIKANSEYIAITRNDLFQLVKRLEFEEMQQKKVDNNDTNNKERGMFE